MLAALDDARRQHLDVVPLCPFVAHLIDEHPEYQDLLETAIRCPTRRCEWQTSRSTINIEQLVEEEQALYERASHEDGLTEEERRRLEDDPRAASTSAGISCGSAGRSASRASTWTRLTCATLRSSSTTSSRGVAP